MCYMFQSCVQFEDYSVAYFDCIHRCVVHLLLRVLLNYMEILYTFEACVPSPQWKSSSTLRMWRCEQNMRWNNWFLHRTVTYLCMYIRTSLPCSFNHQYLQLTNQCTAYWWSKSRQSFNLALPSPPRMGKRTCWVKASTPFSVTFPGSQNA